MQYQGFIKLYRQLLDSSIKEIGIQGIGFVCYCLLKANHKDAKWFDGARYQEIKRGQFITSLPQIADDLKIGIQVARTLLKKFVILGFLTDKSTNKYRLITIVNYSKYQDKPDQLTDKLTGEQQAANKQLTANKNDKNEKNFIGRSQKETDPGVKEFLNYWGETFQKETGQPYVFNFGKEGKLIKDLLQVHSLEALQEMTRAFFKDEQCKRRGLTVGIFFQEINRLFGLKAMSPLEQAKREIRG